MTKIISAFPGTGKSFAHNKLESSSDSDSSMFSWVVSMEGEKVRNFEFPSNYMQHIESLIGEKDYVFVSSHDVVRDALKDYGIDYYLVFPHIKLKEEYIKRFKERQNDINFIQFISDNWENFIQDMEQEDFPQRLRLGEGEYVYDVLQRL